MMVESEAHLTPEQRAAGRGVGEVRSNLRRRNLARVHLNSGSGTPVCELLVCP